MPGWNCKSLEKLTCLTRIIRLNKWSTSNEIVLYILFSRSLIFLFKGVFKKVFFPWNFLTHRWTHFQMLKHDTCAHNCWNNLKWFFFSPDKWNYILNYINSYCFITFMMKGLMTFMRLLCQEIWFKTPTSTTFSKRSAFIQK